MSHTAKNALVSVALLIEVTAVCAIVFTIPAERREASVTGMVFLIPLLLLAVLAGWHLGKRRFARFRTFSMLAGVLTFVLGIAEIFLDKAGSTGMKLLGLSAILGLTSLLWRAGEQGTESNPRG